MRRSESTARRRLDLTVSALVLLAGFCLYFFSLDGHAPSLLRNNLVLDADISSVSRVIASGYTRNLARHPLYDIFLGVPGSLLDSFLHDRITTGRCSSAAAGALAGLIAFRFFARLLGSRIEALWFCLLASCSASVWLSGAIPETHIYNYLTVVTAFALLCAMRGESSGARIARHTRRAILAGVLLAGVTLTNIVYVTLAVGLGLSGGPLPRSRRAGRFAVFLGGTLLLFAACSAAALRVRPGGTNLLTEPAAPLDSEFIRWSRLLEGRSLAADARMFLFGNVIAPPPGIEQVRTIDGFQQMIQLGKVGRPELLLLAWLAVVCAVLARERSTGRPGLAALFAGLVILFNLALHRVFFGNGQPFLFSIHTVFPLVVLLALLYRNSCASTRHLLIGGLACAIVVHNALFMISIDELLSRRCLREVTDARICMAWDPPMSP